MGKTCFNLVSVQQGVFLLTRVWFSIPMLFHTAVCVFHNQINFFCDTVCVFHNQINILSLIFFVQQHWFKVPHLAKVWFGLSFQVLVWQCFRWLLIGRNLKHPFRLCFWSKGASGHSFLPLLVLWGGKANFEMTEHEQKGRKLSVDKGKRQKRIVNMWPWKCKTIQHNTKA